ncbi:unnamed protein product [Diplocarpon coronariae]|nr:hypothetical protein JHW43_002877 [Diplocarpon mali]
MDQDRPNRNHLTLIIESLEVQPNTPERRRDIPSFEEGGRRRGSGGTLKTNRRQTRTRAVNLGIPMAIAGIKGRGRGIPYWTVPGTQYFLYCVVLLLTDYLRQPATLPTSASQGSAIHRVTIRLSGHKAQSVKPRPSLYRQGYEPFPTRVRPAAKSQILDTLLPHAASPLPTLLRIPLLVSIDIYDGTDKLVSQQASPLCVECLR